MTFEIEKNVAMPISTKSGYSSYPLSDMEVGDSFLIPDATMDQKVRARFAVTQDAKRKDRKYTTRTIPEGLRVWRIQ